MLCQTFIPTNFLKNTQTRLILAAAVLTACCARADQAGVKTLQTASVTITSVPQTVTLATPVNAAAAFVFGYVEANSDSNAQTRCTFELSSDGTQVIITGGATGAATTWIANYQVVEFSNGVSVQRGLDSTDFPAGTGGAKSIAISNAPTNKSFALVSVRTPTNNAAQNDAMLVAATLPSATTLTLQRDTQDYAVTVAWQVVTFTDSTTTVQAGTALKNGNLGNNTPFTSTLSPAVVLNQSFLVFSERATNGGTPGAEDKFPVTGLIPNTTTVSFVQAAGTGKIINCSWFVISNPAFAVQSGAGLTAANTPWIGISMPSGTNSLDVTLPTAVNLPTSMVMISTADGLKTLDPTNGDTTALDDVSIVPKLTNNGATLHFERQIQTAAAGSGDIAYFVTTFPKAVFTWNGLQSNNWSFAGNWDSAPVSSTGTTLNFPVGQPIISNDDLAVTPFQLNQLNHSNNSNGTDTISANPGNIIQFAGTTPALNQTGSSPLNISAQVDINSNTAFVATGGLLTLSGPFSGAGNVTITGGFTVTLNNASATASTKSATITGSATGTLEIDSGIGTANVVIPAGGTLTGTGVFTGSVTANGAVISPGDNVGDTRTLTMGGLTVNANTQMNFDLNDTPTGPNNDQIVVNGPLNVDGVLNFNLGAAFTAQTGFPKTYNLITSNEAVNGNIPTAGLITPGFHVVEIDVDPTGQIITVTIDVGTSPPVITSVSGLTRGTNGGNTETINGSNFTPASTVTIGGVNAPVVSETGGTKIIVTTPTIAFNAPTLVVPVQVSNGGVLSNTVNYTYVKDAVPVVTSLNPNYGKPAGGNTTIITGTGFFPNAPTKPVVTVQGAAAAIGTETVNNSTTITLVTPAGNAGSADIIVTNPDGQVSTTGAGKFTYSNPAPASVSPATGSSAGGTAVTITGDFFLPGTGATVTFGSAAAVPATIVNRNTLTCTTPAATAANIGSVNVLVTNTDGSQGTLTNGFTYVQPVTYAPFNANTVGTGTGTATTTLTYFNASQLVTITTPVDAGATIYYTTDGSTPGFTAGTGAPTGTTLVYTAPFTITGTTAQITVKAIAALGTPLQAGPVLNSVYAPYFPASATPVQLTTGSLNYIFNATNSLPPYQTAGATTASGIVTAVAPDVLTDGTQDRTAAFAAGTTQPLPGLLGEGTLLNGRPLADGNSNGSNNLAAAAFQGRFTGIFTVPTTGIYTLVTGSDDGSLMYIDPTSLTAPDAAHIIVANSVGQGVTQRFGQVGLIAGQHTIVIDYANTGGGFALGAFWSPTGATTGFVNIPNGNLGVQAQLAAKLAPTLSTFGGTSNIVTLTQSITISNAAPTGASTFYTTDGTTPTFDANFNPTGTTLIYTAPFNVSATPPVGGTVTVKAIAAGSGYISSALLTQTYTNVAPTVTSLLPAVGSPTTNGAQTVTITGANFSRPGVTSVQFGAGLLATNVVVNSNTVITCTLPNFGGTVPAPVNVIVTNNDAQVGTLTNGFTFTGPPTITSLVVGAGPNSPPNSGTSLGGETFTLTGTNFAAGATFSIGGNAAKNINVVNSTTLTGTTPTSTLPIASGGPGGPVAILYTGQDGRTVTQTGYVPTTSGFNYVAAPKPAVATVSPTVGPFGGGTVITIVGSNFVAGATVKIGTLAATNVIVNSNTSITATTAAGSTGIDNLVVTNVDGQTGTLSGGFTYLGPATGTAISISFNGDTNNGATTITSPLIGTEIVGAGAAARGNWNTSPTATPTGAGNNVSGTMTGLVDSTGTATTVSVAWVSNEAWSNTEGTYNNFIAAGTNPNVRMMRGYLNRTDNTVNGVQVRYNNIPAGFGAFDVYIYGDGANGNVQREGNYTIFGAQTATQHMVDAANVDFVPNAVFIQALPTNAAPSVGNYLYFPNVTSTTGTGPSGTAVTAGFELDVTATSADGSARAPVSGVEIISYNGLQFVGVTPAFGPLAGGTAITLKGTSFANLFSQNLAVSIGGVAATNVTFVDVNTITAVTGAGATAGPQNVVFTNGDAGATQTTVTNGFAYLGPPPTLDPNTPITPNQGITSGGTAISIIGTNFVIGATVTIGGFPATSVVVISSTQITAVTGASTKSGPSDVVVQNAGDTNFATAAGAFNYLAPTIVSLAPTSGLSSGNYNAVITGMNFGTSTKVNFGTLAATNVVLNSNTQITCLVPGSLNGGIGAVDVTVTDGVNSFTTLPAGFTYTTIPADSPGATVAGIEAKFYLNGGAHLPGNAPAAVQTALDALPPVKGLRVDPAVTANIMLGPIADPGVPTAGNVGTLEGLVQDTLGVAATNFYAKFSGYINITTGGGYTFSMGSDDGSLLFISGALVIDANPVGGQAVTPKTGTANLQPGMHAFTILYGQGTGNYGFSLRYSGPDNNNALGFVPDSVLFVDSGSPTLASINPASGPVGGNTVVTATGTGFAPGALVTVNGVLASQIVVNSNTSITFTTPGSATNTAGAVNVVVLNPTGLAATFKSFTYDGTQFRLANNPTNPVPGAAFRFYDLASGNTNVTTSGVLPAPFDPVPFRIGARSTAATYATTITGTPAAPQFNENVVAYPTIQGNNFALQISGYITVPSDGTYTFYTASDDASRLFIGNTIVADNNFGQGVTTRAGTAIKLKGGMHPFTLQYSEGGGGFAAYVGWSSPDSTPVLPADPGPFAHVGKPNTTAGVLQGTGGVVGSPTTILIPDSAFSYVPPTWSASGTSNWSAAANWGTDAGLGAFAPTQLDTVANANESLALRFPAVGSTPYTANNDLAGTTQLFVMELSGNVAGNVIQGNPLQFVGSTSYPYGGITSPTISQVGTGSVTIANNIDVKNGLTFSSNPGGNGVVTLTGVLSDSNSITVVNANTTFVLAGNSSTFNGPITVSDGTLGIGSTASPITLQPASLLVSTGAILRGTGTLNLASIATVMGTIFPGDVTSTTSTQPTGTLTVSGVNLTNGGTYRARVNTKGPSGPINSDLLVLSGEVLTLDSSSTLDLHISSQNAVYNKQDTLIADLTVNGFGQSGFGNITVTPSNQTGVTVLYVAPGFVPGTSPVTDGSVIATQVPGGTYNQNFAATSPFYTQIYVRFDGSVTPATVESFTAKPSGASVELAWNCISEFQNMGFNVYRRDMDGGDWARVNPALIAGRITDAAAKTYRFYDWAPPGVYQYRLDTVNIQGGTETFRDQPGSVTVDGLADGSSLTSDGLNAAVASLGALNNAARAQDANMQFAELGAAALRGDAKRLDAAGSAAVPSQDASVRANEQANASGSAVLSAAVAALNRLQTDSVSHTQLATARGSSAAAPQPASVSPSVSARWFTGSTSSSSTSFTAAKVVYSAPGVMLIPQASLPAGFDIGHISIQRQGQSLPILAQTANALAVYVPGYQDDYTNKDTLFLRTTTAPTAAGIVSHATGLFASNQPVNVSDPATVSTSYHDVYFDYSTQYRPFTFPPWFSSEYLTDGTDQPFALNAPFATSGTASLTVNVWSLTQSETASPDHALQVLVNGQPVGQTQWTGGSMMMQLTFQIPAGVLNAGANQVDLVTPEISGVDSQISFLHSMSLNYTQSLDGSQPVTVTNANSSSNLYELSNLPGANAWVVDTRYSDRATLVPYETQVQNDGTYALRFTASPGGTGQYLVVPFGMENAPLSVARASVKPIKAATYLATGPSQFSAGVQSLLAQRSKEGLRAQFVDQQQIFDYYNYGRYGPVGIQNAVRSTRPQYLLLLGRTTYDYLNYSGANVDPLCPTFLVTTTFWSQATSDSMFGDLGLGYPQVAVGRLPVNDPSELSVAVQHILNYSGAPQSGVRVQATADQSDPSAGDFPTQAATLGQSFPDMSWQANYYGVTCQTVPELTNNMTTAANGGADWMVYIGHGNAAHLGQANDNILDTTLVQAWTGDVVLLQSTCTANWMAMDQTGYKSVAIQALTQTQGGICASVGTSTYMNSDYAVAFMSQVMKNADSPGVRWGNALMKAQQWSAQQGAGFFSDLNKTESIFGDPAMPVFSKTPAPATNPSKPGQTTTTPPPAAGTF